MSVPNVLLAEHVAFPGAAEPGIPETGQHRRVRLAGPLCGDRPRRRATTSRRTAMRAVRGKPFTAPISPLSRRQCRTIWTYGRS